VAYPLTKVAGKSMNKNTKIKQRKESEAKMALVFKRRETGPCGCVS
jgi:hypothetical protein